MKAAATLYDDKNDNSTTVIITTSISCLSDTWMEMYTSHVACCTLANHVECALRTLLSLEKRCDRRMDGQTPDGYIMLTARCDHCNDDLT